MLKVMIAEDDLHISIHLSNAINSENVRCIAILNDGTKIYQKIKETSPDILILDMKMPGKNGIQVLEEISKDKDISTKVIIYSGDQDYIALARKYSCVCRFYSKAIPYSELARVLKEIEEEQSNKSTQNKVSDILSKIGFTYTLKGTRFISDCVLYSIEYDIDNIKKIYEAIARNKGCNKYTFKADINTAVNTMWRDTDREKARKILRIGEKDKPSSKTVIEMVKYYAIK